MEETVNNSSQLNMFPSLQGPPNAAFIKLDLAERFIADH